MKLNEAILATLAYHDIFNFPLTKEEINKYLTVKSEASKLDRELNRLILEKKIGKVKEHYFLKEKQSTTKIRKIRGNNSQEKLIKAKIFASILKVIPTIKTVAISGALAMENSKKNDDIDILIVSAKNTLWTTRFLSNLILFAVKRKPKSKKQSNKACLNIFIDETDLKIKEQNLYTAHEICQIKLLWDRDNTYQKLLKSNSWVKSYLPNWTPEKLPKTTKSWGVRYWFLIPGLRQLENLLKSFQLNYMKSKITIEKIGDRQLFFHPTDNQTKILTDYKKRLKKFKIQTS